MSTGQGQSNSLNSPNSFGPLSTTNLNATNATSLNSPFSPSTNLDTRIELASYTFGQKDFDATREHAGHVLEEVPGDPRALALLAACQILVGNVDAGISGLSQATAGTAIDDYGQVVEEAYEYLDFSDDETVEIDWHGFNACIQFLSQPEFVSEEDSSAWRVALERARACAALERNDASSAIDDLRRHLKKYPQDVEARFELGRAYFKQQEMVIATELFRQVCDEKPDHGFALSLLARIAAIEGDFHTAIQYGVPALELSPQNCRMRLDLAEYYLANEDFAASLAVLENAEKCVCAWFEVLHCRLECYLKIDDFSAAADICDQMRNCQEGDVVPGFDLELGHRVATAGYLLCVAELEGDEKSLMLLEQEADLLVGTKWFAIDTAAMYQSLGHFELARRLVECLSYLHPHDYEVLLALALAERLAGDSRREQHILRQLVVDLPECGAAYLQLAICYQRASQYKESLYWAHLAAGYEDPDGQVAFQLARTYAMIDATQPCLKYLEQALKTRSSFRGKAETDRAFDLIRELPGFQNLLKVDSRSKTDPSHR